MKILSILAMVVAGASTGAGAGFYLRPPPPPCEGEDCPEVVEVARTLTDTYAYVDLNNQFVVPLTDGPRVKGLVAISLSVEVNPGFEAMVRAQEPRLRDAFLRVLFAHAQTRGFDEGLTTEASMSDLRNRLTQVAIEAMGPDIEGVLVTNLVRQDF